MQGCAQGNPSHEVTRGCHGEGQVRFLSGTAVQLLLQTLLSSYVTHSVTEPMSHQVQETPSNAEALEHDCPDTQNLRPMD